jgi:hypothetical protein
VHQYEKKASQPIRWPRRISHENAEKLKNQRTWPTSFIEWSTGTLVFLRVG